MIYQQLHDFLYAALWVCGLVTATVFATCVVRVVRPRNEFNRAFVQVSPTRWVARDLQDSPPPQTAAEAYPQDRPLEQ